MPRLDLNLAAGLYASSQRAPESLALSVEGADYTYARLRELVQPVASWLRQAVGAQCPRIGILASRSLATYLGVLGACWAGGTYVPLNPKYPEDRLIQFLQRSALDGLVVGASSARLLTERLLDYVPGTLLVPDRAESLILQSRGGRLILAAGSLAFPKYDPSDEAVPIGADHVVYNIFTSGTTGIPKGVMISAGAVSHFISVMRSRYQLTSSERVAGITEITFDLSVFDMFVTWACGAALLVVPPGQVMAPLSFVQRRQPTVIFMVPSIAANMQKMKLLASDSMPSLRYSFFAGEPLPLASATLWKQSACNSVVENLYGPTEATVVCIGQEFDGAQGLLSSREVVPIGLAFAGMQAGVFDSSLRPLAKNERGELLLSGPQLSVGYANDMDLSRERFPIIGNQRWYRTGDIALQDDSGVFHHFGRIDNQVKVRGLRVELEDIESHLRDVYETDSVAAVAWPVEHGSAKGIVAFVSGDCRKDNSESRARIRDRLPEHMIPTAIHSLPALPLNENGKVDRRALVALLAEEKL